MAHELLEKRVLTYIAVILVISIAAIYVVFLIPAPQNRNVQSGEGEEIVKGEAPVAVINISGGIKVPGESIVLVESGKSIVFDASDSYDPDGEITEYEWSFGDDVTEKGKEVTHTFYLDQESFSKYGSVTYPVILRVYDNSLPYRRMDDELLLVTVIPSQLYLTKGSLSVDKPSPEEDIVKLPLFNTVELNYNVSNPFYLPSSSCNIFLHIKKPRLSIINKISIIYYDSDGNEIPLIDIPRSKLLGFWKEKTINASAVIQDTGGGVAGFKIGIKGLSLRGISLIYGGDEVSLIKFSLT